MTTEHFDWKNMKVKTIKIVESLKEYDEDLLRRLHDGSLDKNPEVGVAVMTPETFAQIFSPERIKLLQRIHKNKITSIYQLAKELNKPYEVVFRNIQMLEGLGVILVKTRANKRIPVIAERFNIEMFADMPA